MFLDCSRFDDEERGDWLRSRQHHIKHRLRHHVSLDGMGPIVSYTNNIIVIPLNIRSLILNSVLIAYSLKLKKIS